MSNGMTKRKNNNKTPSDNNKDLAYRITFRGNSESDKENAKLEREIWKKIYLERTKDENHRNKKE